VAAILQDRGLAQDVRQSGFAQITRDRMSIVERPADALTVFDFEATARQKVTPGHWSYMASGVDEDATFLANREGFRQVQLRPRRLHDATKVDMRVEWFGTTHDSPIFTCTDRQPALVSRRGGGGRCPRRRCPRHDADVVHVDVEDVNKALGPPLWQQLYAPNSWGACAQLLKRVEASGVTVIALSRAASAKRIWDRSHRADVPSS
jgi:4-hydroxymandelate oxidase